MQTIVLEVTLTFDLKAPQEKPVCICRTAWLDEHGRHLKYNYRCPIHGPYKG